MGDIERDQRWTLRGGLEFNAAGEREILASGTGLAYGEEVVVVRESQFRGAVEALQRVATRPCATDADTRNRVHFARAWLDEHGHGYPGGR